MRYHSKISSSVPAISRYFFVHQLATNFERYVAMVSKRQQQGQDTNNQYTEIRGRKGKLDKGKKKCKNEDGEGGNHGNVVIDSVEQSKQEAQQALDRLRGAVKDAIKQWEDD